MIYFYVTLKMFIIYIVMIVLLRILGKREVGQLSIFDLVVLLIIADIASLGVDNDDFFILSLFCLLVLVFLQKVLSIFLLKNAKFRSLIDGVPVTIVKNGKLLIENMEKEKYTIDDLISQMRAMQIMDISKIKLAFLENNGSLSVFCEKDFNNVILPIITSGVYIKDSFDVLGLEIKKIEELFKKLDLNINDILYCSYGDNEICFCKRKNRKEKELELQKIKL